MHKATASKTTASKTTVWKAIGMAGAAGVVASGVLVARSERARRSYTPDEVRERLHQRYARAVAAERDVIPLRPAPAGPVRSVLRRLRHRFR